MKYKIIVTDRGYTEGLRAFIRFKATVEDRVFGEYGSTREEAIQRLTDTLREEKEKPKMEFLEIEI